MLKVLFVAIGLLFAGSALADEPRGSTRLEQDTCVSFEAEKTKHAKEGWTFIEVVNDAKAAWLAHYNSLPPVGNEQPTHLWVASLSQQENVVIIFVDDQGCIRNMGAQAYEQFEKWATDQGI